jgi:hypothetical protein
MTWNCGLILGSSIDVTSLGAPNKHGACPNICPQSCCLTVQPVELELPSCEKYKLKVMESVMNLGKMREME